VGRPREELIQLAHQAKAFQEPIVSEFLETTEWKLFKAWKESPADQNTKREELYLQCLGLQAFRDFTRKVLIDGEQAEIELKQGE
jgi:hypothetical protein